MSRQSYQAVSENTPMGRMLYEHHERVSRLENDSRDVASQISGLTIISEELGRRVSEGFQRVGTNLERVTELLDKHDTHLVKLIDREERSRTVIKWVAGIFGSVAATVLAALVIIFLRR